MVSKLVHLTHCHFYGQNGPSIDEAFYSIRRIHLLMSIIFLNIFLTFAVKTVKGRHQIPSSGGSGRRRQDFFFCRQSVIKTAVSILIVDDVWLRRICPPGFGKSNDRSEPVRIFVLKRVGFVLIAVANSATRRRRICSRHGLCPSIIVEPIFVAKRCHCNRTQLRWNTYYDSRCIRWITGI